MSSKRINGGAQGLEERWDAVGNTNGRSNLVPRFETPLLHQRAPLFRWI
jgi:hypothetical protein